MEKNDKDKITVDRFDKYAEIEEMYSSKVREVKLTIPSNLRMLCAILKIKVEDLLNDYMWMLSYSAHRKANKKKRTAARKFFLSSKYGQPFYSKKQINQMFDELKAEREIYETTDGMNHEDMELFWRNNHMYQKHWFKRWFKKNRRKEGVSVLEEY